MRKYSRPMYTPPYRPYQIHSISLKQSTLSSNGSQADNITYGEGLFTSDCKAQVPNATPIGKCMQYL